MSKLVVICNLTLDGAMQAPGSPDEDERGGFTHGGWAAPYSHDAMGRLMAEGDGSRNAALLLGRITYERFASYWPNQPANPYTEVLNRQQKYVASRTLEEPLPWVNSSLLTGDAADAVAALKKDQPDQDLVVLGSGDLVRSLRRHDLIDEYKLLIHPLVLGSGRRLFTEDGTAAKFELTDCVGTTTGVVIATYRPA
ncbi:MAG TPA: dihydrofolate reductase family protein [Kribbella sp.]|nr:dihydrofolate reductase family protein [Kribbella sp.]